MDLLKNISFEQIEQRRLAFRAVLVETWYAIKDFMLSIHKSGHLVDDSGREKSYQQWRS